MPSPVLALTGCSAWKSPSVAAFFICSAMWPGLSRSTLLSAITTGQPSSNTRLRDVAVAGADALARVEDEHDHVEVVGDRLLDAALHPLGQRVDRLLPAGEVDEDELRVVAPSRRRGCGGASCAGRCETIATFSPVSAFDERRLADVRPPGERGEARPHSGRFQVSGSSSPGVAVRSSPSSRAVADLADPELVQPLAAAAAR